MLLEKADMDWTKVDFGLVKEQQHKTGVFDARDGARLILASKANELSVAQVLKQGFTLWLKENWSTTLQLMEERAELEGVSVEDLANRYLGDAQRK